MKREHREDERRGLVVSLLIISAITIIFFNLPFLNAETGCCFNPENGQCSMNADRDACEGLAGEFSDNPQCTDSKCDLGCCVIGGETSMITQRACEMLTREREFDLNWQTIDEKSCSDLGNAGDLGACLLGGEYERNCQMADRSDCPSGDFHAGLLCTAPELNTICIRTERTGLIEGRDEIYFLDSCGNTANIYDYDKAEDRDYWTYIVKRKNSCGAGQNNAGSDICGNCNYNKGSIAVLYTIQGSPGKPKMGNYICKDINCGNYLNGDSWCENPSTMTAGDYGVGSRFLKKTCINGEEIVEPCADFRSEICSESDGTAECETNPYSDCLSAGNDTEDCSDAGDYCNIWSLSGITGWASNRLMLNELGLSMCMSEVGGGFEFWESSGSSSICSYGNKNLSVTFYNAEGTSRGGLSVGFGASDYGRYGIATTTGAWGNAGLLLGIANVGQWGNEDGNSRTGTNSNYYVGDSRFKTRDRGGLGGIFSGSDNKPMSDCGCYAGYIYESLTGSHTTITPSMNYLPVSPAIINTLTERCRLIGDCDAKVDWSTATNRTTVTAGTTRYSLDLGRWVTVSSSDSTTKEQKKNWIGSEGDGVGSGIQCYQYASTNSSGTTNYERCDISCVAGSGGVVTCALNFQCVPFEAPDDDSSCSSCGQGNMPCSEYACESLGDDCEYTEPEGADRAYCVASSDNSAPAISLVSQIPENPVPPYTPVEFTISTNEDSICKFNFNTAGGRYSAMKYDFGNEGFSTQHKVMLNLPSQAPNELGLQEYNILKEGRNNIYVRCLDAAGNGEAMSPFRIEFEVMKTPDRIPPVILNYTPSSNSAIKYNTTQKEVTLMLNEPSECKWGFNDTSFELMNNEFICETRQNEEAIIRGNYLCSGTLTNITKNISQVTKFYIRCKDQPRLEGRETDLYRRNTNDKSFVYILRPSEMLNISQVIPTGEIKKTSENVSIELKITTSGGGYSGISTCKWRVSKSPEFNTPFVNFYRTRSNYHYQLLNSNITSGNYYVQTRCVDNAENIAEREYRFNLIIDRTSPSVSRIFSSGNALKIITTEESICYYSNDNIRLCLFGISNATQMSGAEKEHTAEWNNDQNYYIKCKDYYGNYNNGCAAIVRTY